MKIIRNNPSVTYEGQTIIEGIETTGETQHRKIETTPSTKPPGPIILDN